MALAAAMRLSTEKIIWEVDASWRIAPLTCRVSTHPH
jgi:hypothetical protein